MPSCSGWPERRCESARLQVYAMITYAFGHVSDAAAEADTDISGRITFET